MSNDIIPLISRRNTRVIYDDYLSAIDSLNSRNINKGEVFYIAYNSSLPNYNIPYKRVDIILAYGIQNGEYRILNFCTSNIIYGVKYNIPSMEDLVQNQLYLYNDKKIDKWYLVFSLDGINRQIQEISAQPQTFIDIETGNLWVSFNDKKVRCLNDVCTKEEATYLLNNLEFSQKDWKETDTNNPSFIRNKPKLSDLGTLTYTIEREELTKKIIYNLYWTEYSSQNQLVSGSIDLDENKVLKSVELDVVTENNKNLLPENWNLGDRFLDFLISGINDSHVYIYMEPLITNYTSGDGGIQINNNIISVKVDTESGLTTGLSWELATSDNNGAISAADHKKINNFNSQLYTTNTKLNSGEIVAKSSSGTRGIESPGIITENTNSVISTLSEQLYIKDTSSIEEMYVCEDNANVFNIKIKSTGANLFNPINTKTGFKIDNNGDIIEDANYSLAWCLGIKNKQNTKFNEPIYDNGYVINKNNCTVAYLNNLEDLSSTILNKSTTIFGTESYIIPEEGKILVISILTEDLGDLCIKFAFSGKNVEEYEEYSEDVIDLSEFDLCYFSDELKDCFINTDGILYLKTTGTKIEHAEEQLNWIQGDSVVTSNSINLELEVGQTLNLIYVTSNNTIPCSYEQENLSLGKITLITDSIVEGTLYYPTQESIVNTNIPGNIKINAGGMEYFEIVSKKVTSNPRYYLKQIIYQDFIEQLSNFRGDLNKKLGISDIDTNIISSSENPVANKVIKKYIDDIISARRDVEIKDLSRYDIFGMPNTGMTTANCYVVSETGTYKIPLVYGNAIKNGVNNESAYTATSNESKVTDYVNYLNEKIVSPYIEVDTNTVSYGGVLIWEETNNMISDLEIINGENCRYLKFKVNNIPLLNSNALIGIEDNSHEIIWSWHIWVVSDIDELHPIKIKNRILVDGDVGSSIYQIMPVNLGSVKIAGQTMDTSVYYQWGRKDPFPRANSLSENATSVETFGDVGYSFGTFGSDNEDNINNTIGNSIKHPNLFFLRYSSTNLNWFAPVYNTVTVPEIITTVPCNLWSSNSSTYNSENANSIKTIYDPCPVGWKVPPRDLFRGFTKKSGYVSNPDDFNVVGTYSNGWIFKKYYEDTVGTIFPANGFRSRSSSGSIKDVTLKGNYWTSSVYNQDTISILYFTDSIVYPSSTNYTTGGYSVRPILEE